jgi:hypothetical protein
MIKFYVSIKFELITSRYFYSKMFKTKIKINYIIILGQMLF